MGKNTFPMGEGVSTLSNILENFSFEGNGRHEYEWGMGEVHLCVFDCDVLRIDVMSAGWNR